MLSLDQGHEEIKELEYLLLSLDQGDEEIEGLGQFEMPTEAEVQQAMRVHKINRGKQVLQRWQRKRARGEESQVPECGHADCTSKTCVDAGNDALSEAKRLTAEAKQIVEQLNANDGMDAYHRMQECAVADELYRSGLSGNSGEHMDHHVLSAAKDVINVKRGSGDILFCQCLL